jgi:hypothetical protein
MHPQRAQEMLRLHAFAVSGTNAFEVLTYSPKRCHMAGVFVVNNLANEQNEGKGSRVSTSTVRHSLSGVPSPLS